MSGPYQGRDLSNCGVGRLRVAINCGVLSVTDGYLKVLFLAKDSIHGRGGAKNNGYKLGECLTAITLPTLTYTGPVSPRHNSSS